MKNLSDSVYQLVLRIADYSPKQQKIAKYFYIIMKYMKAGKLKTLNMSVGYIAHKCKVCVRTVQYFLAKNKDVIMIGRQNYRPNLYLLISDFFRALQFCDDFGLFDLCKKDRIRLVVRMSRKAFFPNENVQILHPSCPNFAPKSFFYSSDLKVPPKRAFKYMSNEEKQAIFKKEIEALGLPEAAIEYAKQDYLWYSKSHKVASPVEFVRAQAERHLGLRPWRDGRIKPSFVT